jgi:CitMHS family citrate-Mg2+:H+ or citrate-Ca2+:H+ symporter
MLLIVLGYAMVAAFMVLIMTNRLSAFVALILVPIVFGLLAGHRADLVAMGITGMVKLAPTAILLLCAVLYFGIMIDAGLFDPLVKRVLAAVGTDPMRVAIGTAIVALLVSLDGDGTTTVLVTVTAFLPLYQRLRMNPLIIAVLLGAANSTINIVPWGGPTGRVASALGVDISAVFLPLLPTMAIGIVATLAFAWYLGRQERNRLGVVGSGPAEMPAGELFGREEGASRPRLFWFNLVLTVAALAGAVTRVLPLPVVFMLGLAIALTVNYPRLKDQRARIAAHAPNALPIVLLIFAAGVFTGIFNGTGMLDAMAKGAVAAMPPALGPWLAPVTALLSAPLTFVLSTDAYYFGVVPVIAKTAAAYGVDPVLIARASLLGQPVHVLSPLVAAVYLVAGLLDTDVGALQRFCLKWAVLLVLILIVSATLTGALW